jgi:hypothetical protein
MNQINKPDELVLSNYNKTWCVIRPHAFDRGFIEPPRQIEFYSDMPDDVELIVDKTRITLGWLRNILDKA